MSKTTAQKFGDLNPGEIFLSTSGEFVKINDGCAKRTEAHWADSDKVWRFSSISTVYTEA